MNLVYRIAIVCFILVYSEQAYGQESANLRGDSAQTRRRLVEAEQKLLAGKTADALDDLQRVLDESGDNLITIDGKHYLTARRVAHGILARFPPDALKSYQDRVENPARKLLDAALVTKDPAPLWQLIDRYLVSRPADAGLLLLGDLLFERGEFRSAEQIWRRLIPGSGAELEYPRSSSDRAAVRARIILSLIFQGQLDEASLELSAFRIKHPGASGILAGKGGQFADTLQAIFDSRPTVSTATNSGEDWPTFGGGADRSGRVAARLSGEWPARPWSTTIPSAIPRHELAPSAPPARLPFSNPIVAKGHVLVTDGWQLFAFDLITGSKAPALTLSRPAPFRSGDKPPPDASPTLSASGDRIFVRVGPGAIRPADGTKRDETTIACVLISRNTDGTIALKKLWSLAPPLAEDNVPVLWEGAPLVSGRRMWIATARFEGGRVVHGITCYNPCDTLTSPDRPVWSIDVCDGPAPIVKDGSTAGRARHELLTLAGRNVVFCSNAGAVIALDASTGRRAWGFRYHRASKGDSARTSDPRPAIAFEGRVFVAPADSDRVYALDQETGKPLWESLPTEGAQLLGVANGRLVLTVAGSSKGIRGLSVQNGTYREPGGWIHDRPDGVPGYGRGFIADDMIVWPTRNGLRFLNPHDGTPIHRELLPHVQVGQSNGTFGNVIFADGVLVVVTPTEVWGYVSDARRFGPPDEPPDDESARARFERLIEKAERALASRDEKAARLLLMNAIRSELPRAYRAWAAARLLLLTPTNIDSSKSAVEMIGALATDLRDEWLFPPDGLPVTLGELLERHRGSIREKHLATDTTVVSSERQPSGPSSLSPDAEITRTLRLSPGSAPLQTIPGALARPKRLFVFSNGELVAVKLADGENARFESDSVLTHAAELTDGFVAVGPRTVAIYHRTRSPVWLFRIPTTVQLPARPGTPYLFFGITTPPPELSSFRLSGPRLFARLGQHHLIAFDLNAKRVAWVLGSDGKSGFHQHAFPEAARFGPTFGIAGAYLIVQRSDGRRWVIRAESGEVLDIPELGEKTAKVWWPEPPCEVAAGTILEAAGPGLIRMVHLPTGKRKWTHRVEGESSLTGVPPQLRALEESILLAARRNHGVELDHISLSDGKSLWNSDTMLLDTDNVDLRNADADAERVFLPVGNAIKAVTLKDGKNAWEAELPDTNGAGGWVIRAGPKCVIAYPVAAIPREPLADVLARVTRSFENEPALWRLPGLLASAYDAWVARTMPVLLFDPETGRTLARFDLPAAGPAVAAFFERDLAVVATGDRVVWLR